MEIIILKTSAMFLFMTLFILSHACDLETQYEKDEKCCNKCGPGKRMNSQYSCEDPLCVDCNDNEYQDGYTMETKCKQQPYCDPNMHFEQVPLTKMALSPCKCMKGYHCSSNGCHTCLKNSLCKDGFGVKKMATRENDTVCEECPEGTFSSESSEVDKCRPWTKCESGFVRKENSGTTTSDAECVKEVNVGLIIGISTFLILLAVVVSLGLSKKSVWMPKLAAKFMQRKEENGNVNKQQEQERRLIDLDVEGRPPQNQRPEETEDPSLSHPVQAQGMTDNDKPVRQEEGKAHHTSQPETQQPYI